MQKPRGFVQVHRDGSSEPEQPIWFLNARSMIEFVERWKPKTLGDCLRVHIPAHYTDQERQELIDLGAKPG